MKRRADSPSGRRFSTWASQKAGLRSRKRLSLRTAPLKKRARTRRPNRTMSAAETVEVSEDRKERGVVGGARSSPDSGRRGPARASAPATHAPQSAAAVPVNAAARRMHRITVRFVEALQLGGIEAPTVDETRSGHGAAQTERLHQEAAPHALRRGAYQVAPRPIGDLPAGDHGEAAARDARAGRRARSASSAGIRAKTSWCGTCGAVKRRTPRKTSSKWRRRSCLTTLTRGGRR